MKKINLRYFLFALLCFISIALSAQDSKTKRANELFDKFSFPEAAEAYKKLLAKEDIAEAKIKLADCYRFMNMPIEAEYWYEQVVQLSESEPIHKYYFGMALKSNGKFEEAKQQFLQYAQLVPADTRGLRQVEACEQATYFMTDPGIYQITLANNVNSGKADFGPAFYKEGIIYASEENVKNNEMEYNWREQPFLDLFYAKKEGENPAQLGKGETFKGTVNTYLHEGTLTFTSDFSTMYFTRNSYYRGRIGYDTEEKLKTVNLQIFEAKADGDKFGDIKSLPFNNDDYSVGHPALSPDGQALYFVSDMPGGYGGTDLYVSYKSGDSWGQPENIGPEINTEGNEMFPFMSKDGTLFFSSDALPGLGGLDIFSTKQLSDGTWGQAENLRYPINTNADDFALIIDEKNENGYFSSNRPGGKGDDDIYSFTRLNNIMTGIVVDCNTQKPVQDAEVELNEGGAVMQKRKTNASGTFTFPMSPGKEYIVIATKEGYEEGTQNVNTIDVSSAQIDIKIPICPKKDTGKSGDGTDGNGDPNDPNNPNGGSGGPCTVVGKITDKTTGKAVNGAVVKLTDLNTREEKTFVTGPDGGYTFSMGSEADYTVFAQKEFYFSETKTVSSKGVDCSKPLAVDLGMGRIPVNGNGDPINGTNGLPPVIRDDATSNIGTLPDWLKLNHIYYDFDKDAIRADAKPELDKVMRLMAENPGLKIELRSHTDARGTHEYNQALSDRRAQSARDYLLSRGVNAEDIAAKGFGETQLANDCADGVPCSNAKHQENRRTEFAITGYSVGGALQSLPRYYYKSDYHQGKNYYKSGADASGADGGSSSSSSSSTSGGTYTDGGSWSNSSSSTTTSGSSYSGSSNISSGGTYYDQIGMVGGGGDTKYVNCCGVTLNAGSGGSSSSSAAPSSGSYSNPAPSTYKSSGSMSSPASSGSNKSYSNDHSTSTTTTTTEPAVSGSAMDNSMPAPSSSASSSENIEYKVQIGNYRDPEPTQFDALNELGTIEAETTATGTKRIILGTFPDKGSANATLTKVQQRGFNEAYIVTYQNGLRVGR